MNAAPALRNRRGFRIAVLYFGGAFVLIGWAAYLGVSLPDRNVAQHWNAAWVGLDCLIVVALALTARTAALADPRVVIAATFTAALLVADAWMDITTSARADLSQSIALAMLVELPLAALSLVVARRALARVARRL